MRADVKIIELMGVILKYDPLFSLLDFKTYLYNTNLKSVPTDKDMTKHTDTAQRLTDETDLNTCLEASIRKISKITISSTLEDCS